MHSGPIVYVVDDDDEVRRSVDLMLNAAGLRVQAFSSAEEFLTWPERANETSPQCLVIDAMLPGMSGLALQRLLSERRDPIPVVMLTGNGTIPLAVETVKRGAVEFLEKPVHRRLLLDSIQAALDRDAVRRQEQARIGELRQRLSRLTSRESEVLEMMREGKNNKTIAVELGIGLQTAAKHTSRVLDKLGVANGVELVNLLNAHRGSRASSSGVGKPHVQSGISSPAYGLSRQPR